MCAAPLLRREIIDLQRFVAATVAMLPIVPTAEVALRRNPVGRSAVAKDIAVKFLGAEAGLQQGAGFEGRLFVEREEPSALMSVGGRLDGIESVQVEVIKLLRKQRETYRQTVFRIDDPVEP